MDLTFSTEQTQLRDSVVRFVADHGIRGKDGRPRGFRADLWRQMAELGWLGAGLAEDEGGFGGGPVETLIVMEECGRGILPEPLLPAVIAARLLATAQPHGLLLGDLLSGAALVLPALEDRRGGTPSSLHAAAGKPMLTGGKELVEAAEHASHLLVPCVDVDGAPALIAVARDAPGVALHGFRTLDARRAATVEFDGVQLGRDAILARGLGAQAVLDAARAAGIAALCAEATGVAGFLFDQTLGYLKVRKQFGQPIGRFQALQHRMADVYVALEEARSLALMAALRLCDTPSPARTRALSAAKLGVIARALHVAREAIQMHGGIGMTEELPVGAGLRRIKALQMRLGGEGEHLDRMATTPYAAAV